MMFPQRVSAMPLLLTAHAQASPCIAASVHKFYLVFHCKAGYFQLNACQPNILGGWYVKGDLPAFT